MGILKMPRLRPSILFKVMVMVSICLQMMVIYMLHSQNTEIVLQDTQSHFTYRELLNLPQQEDDWRRKSLMFNINKTEQRFLTIGIPTVRRQVSNYFMKTLDSIVNCTSKEQFSEIFIVILLADFNITWRLEMASMIKDRYTPLVTNGAIQVIEAPREFYPPLDNLQHTYNDSQLKKKWRSKQNVDYAFLWLYSKDLSTYYMQIEDDIYTVPGYINIIKQFISIQNGDWTCLEFGELGFIGKLYPTKYLERLAKTVLLFYEEQPVDVTFFHFNILNLQTQRIIRRPTIFQHVGYHSSLPGKIQTLTDQYFPDNVQKVVKGDNPPAKIVTTFRISPAYPPEAAYSANNGYFWAQSPANMHDTIHVLFNEPVIIDKVIILTGSKGHPYDKIYNAKLDVCLSVRRIFVFQIQCINEIYIGTFVNGTIEELNLATRLHNVKVESLRITMTKSQEFWVLVKEIAVFVKPQLGMNLHFPVGYHSSLPGKIQTLTDQYFPDNVQKVVKGDNPPAKIVTTFRISPAYPPEAAYSANNGYFWAQSPANMHDTIHVLFNEPVIIDKVIILTGSKGHPYDKIYNAKLDVCLSVRRIFVFQIQCINEIYIGTFVNGTIEELNLATRLHNVKVESLRITMTKSQEFWVLVKEIAVFVKPQLGMNLHFPVGYHSSLPGKIQTLTDQYFPDNVQKVVKGDNPPAKIVTTFRISPAYPPEAAYSANNGYFWAQSPANMHDTIHVLFNEPVIIDKVIILTGSKGHPYDKIYNAKLDVCLSVRRILVFQIQCINEIYIGTFVNGTIEELNLATRLHNVKVESLRITMTKSQEFWVLVKEIAVFVKPQLGMNLHFPVNAKKALRKQIFKQIHLPVDIENIRKLKLFNREAFGINR